MTRGDNYLVGGWVAGEAGTSERRDPGSLEHVVGVATDASLEQVHIALDAAARAQPAWAGLPSEARTVYLRAVVDDLELQTESLAVLISQETGKLRQEALSEVRSTITDARYQIDTAEKVRVGYVPPPRNVATPTGAESRSPLGLVLAMTPWNFPVATIFRKLIPALAYGNTVIVKPSELSPLSATQCFESVARSALPSGVVQLLQGTGPIVGSALAEGKSVDGITFTGSTHVGAYLAKLTAGRNVRLQLELGGKNAVIVLRDADLDLAAQAIVAGAFSVAGQWCTGTSRVIAESSIHDRLVERVVDLATEIRVGSSRSHRSTMGPVVSAEQRALVGGAIDEARRRQGEPLLGGALVDEIDGHRGYFVEPTIFVDTDPEDPLAQNEVFGPVLAIMKAGSVDQAIDIANGTGYGLSMSVFTEDESEATRVVGDVKAGLCHVNLPTFFRQPHLPLGGWRGSGLGTPECGDLGAEAFTRVRAVYSRY